MISSFLPLDTHFSLSLFIFCLISGTSRRNSAPERGITSLSAALLLCCPTRFTSLVSLNAFVPYLSRFPSCLLCRSLFRSWSICLHPSSRRIVMAVSYAPTKVAPPEGFAELLWDFAKEVQKQKIKEEAREWKHVVLFVKKPSCRAFCLPNSFTMFVMFVYETENENGRKIETRGSKGMRGKDAVSKEVFVRTC